MGYYNIASIYMRLRRNAQVTPAEVLILVKDMDLRLSDMEGKSNETRVEDLVKFLRQKYPPIEFNLDNKSETFLEEAIFRSGQREVINTIEHIIRLQNNKGG